VQLNVIPLIDICALTIIFMVMEAFFGESSIVIPKDIEVPKSASKESIENAPRVVIENSMVIASFLKEPIPLAWFDPAAGTRPELADVREKIKQFVEKVPVEARKSGVLLNVIADERAPYKTIFDVIAVFRESGFHSMLFVARGS
jgi:biopolymer transport protein ExbD